MGTPIELFCCYAHEDEDDLKKLFQHLRVLERTGLIRIWYGRAIQPGEDWEAAINAHLNSAQIILLIASASFFDSDTCYDKEMPRALARHEDGQARLLPVILHPCDWKITPLGRLQVLPTTGLPISLWPNQSSAFLDVIEGVKQIVLELRVETLFQAGLEHYNAEHYDEALAVFDQALSLAHAQEEPTVPASLLAQLYQRKGDALFIKKNLLDTVSKSRSQVPRLSQMDWGDAPELSVLYGRQSDLDKLIEWVATDHCQLILVSGVGGVGKTAVATKLAKMMAGLFESVIWRSLRDAPPLEKVLTDCIHFLSRQQVVDLPQDINGSIGLLMKYLELSRCLIVLDNAEAVLREGQAGEYRAGYESYGSLFSRVGEIEHQSCLILTSREKPREIGLLEGNNSPVRSYQVSGLTIEGGQLMIAHKDLSGSPEAWRDLVSYYSGNPLALSITAEMIRDVYAGSVDDFLADGQIVLGQIDNVIGQQFHRLSSLERSIMFWLSIEREAVTREKLWDNMVSFGRRQNVLEGLQSLLRRSLIERASTGFTLQNVIMEFVSNRLTDEIYEEIITGYLNLLQSHPIFEAQTKEYVRESQARIILKPLCERLLGTLTSRDAENKLRSILSDLRRNTSTVRGYAAGNVLNLLLHLGADVRGYDFSHLCVWQAYLQQANLQDVNFSHADLSKSVFDEDFGGILSLAYSLDGALLAAGTTNNLIRVWTVADGRQLLSLRDHTDWVGAVTFGSDSSILASGSNDGSIRLWNTKTGGCVEILQAHKYRVRSVVFSPRHDVIVSGGGDPTVRLWGAVTGECIKELEGHTDWVDSVAFSIDGTLIASGSYDQTVRLWDSKNGQCLQVLEGHEHWVRSVAFSPTGNLLASGGGDWNIRLWDLKTGECISLLKGHTDSVITLSFWPDGTILASGSSDTTVRLWDLATLECFKTLTLHNDAVRAVIFSPDGLTLASGSEDHVLRLWDAKTGQSLKALQGKTNPVGAVAFDSGGEILASGSADRVIRLWGVNTGQILRVLQGHEATVMSVVFTPDSNLLISGSSDNTIRLWDVKTGQRLGLLQGHNDWIWSIAISPDGRILASGSIDRTIRLWNLKTGRCLKTLRGHSSRVMTVTFSPDGSLVASGSADHTIKVWNVDTGQCLRTLEGHADLVRGVVFAPTRPLLASCSVDQSVRLWDISTWEVIRVIREHTGPVMAVAISPNSKLLASGSTDQTIRIWDTETGQCSQVLHGHTGGIWSVTFGPTGNVLASASHDETIRLWNVQTSHCIRIYRPERAYERMNIANASGLTEAQKDTLKALGAIESVGSAMHLAIPSLSQGEEPEYGSLLLISALYKERDALLTGLSNLPSINLQQMKGGSVRVLQRTSGIIVGDVTALANSGNVVSEQVVKKAIADRRPKLVILYGIAAGIRGRVELGDVLITDQVWDLRKLKLGTEFEFEPRHLQSSQQISLPFLIENLRRKLREEFKDNIHIHVDLVCGSSDNLIRSRTYMESAAKTNRKLGAMDIEAAGVARACIEAEVPFFAIKAISDYGDKEKNDTYHDLGCRLVASTIIHGFLDTVL